MNATREVRSSSSRGIPHQTRPHNNPLNISCAEIRVSLRVSCPGSVAFRRFGFLLLVSALSVFLLYLCLHLLVYKYFWFNFDASSIFVGLFLLAFARILGASFAYYHRFASGEPAKVKVCVNKMRCRKPCLFYRQNNITQQQH